MKKKPCSICFKFFDGYGNNAQPINDGLCCDNCNRLVILERIRIWRTTNDTKKRPK